MRLTVSVTQADIEVGVPCDSQNCAVALAIRRAVGPERTVIVGSLDAYVDSRMAPLNNDVRTWIGMLDHAWSIRHRDGEVWPPRWAKPITFDITVPE